MNFDILIDGHSVVKGEANLPLLQRLLATALHMNVASPTYSSHPANDDEMAELLERVDPKSVRFLKAIAVSPEGKITWAEMKSIFSIDEWVEYSSSYGKGITRALRSIVDSKTARLILWDDETWDGEDDDSDANVVFVDGPALHSLRRAAGVIK